MTKIAIQPTAIYTRPELRIILGYSLADSVCTRSRKVKRGKYLGRHVLEALERMSTENEYVTRKPVPSFQKRKRGVNAPVEKDWSC